jgi:oligopeptide transport system substrate-binding protein
MPFQWRVLRIVGGAVLLVYLALACSLTKGPTPTAIPVPRATDSPSPEPSPTPTTLAIAEPTSTPISSTDTPTPLPTDTPEAAPTATPTPAPPGGEIRLFGPEPVALDPALAGDAGSHEYIGKIFSGLVRMSGDLEVWPDIAERWEVDDSGTVYTFFLCSQVKFHNGQPVTAHDVKYSIERACDPKTGSRVASAYLGDIVGVLDRLSGRADEVSGVDVLDDHTLRITIDAPKAYFLAKLTYPTSYVVDQEQVVDAAADWWKKANGTGPFLLTSFDDTAITLQANDDFYRQRPFLDKIIFRRTGGGPIGQYERGEIDAAPVSAADIDRVLDPNNPLYQDLLVVPSLDTIYLAFNTTMPPFEDVKVRQAFAYATNKRAIADIILNKMVEPAAGILPPNMPGHSEDLEGIPFDPDRALDLLDESSYAADLPPIVYTVSGEGGVSAMTEALTESYRQILGAEIEIQQMSWPLFLEGLNERQFQMFSLGWIADYPDPENFLDLLFHSRSEYNHTAYSNPAVDELLEQARTEADRATRLRLYQQVEEMLVWDAAWIPLYHGVVYHLIKPYVKGLIVSPQGFYILDQVVVEPH